VLLIRRLIAQTNNLTAGETLNVIDDRVLAAAPSIQARLSLCLRSLVLGKVKLN
jgi:hypothetical protein